MASILLCVDLIRLGSGRADPPGFQCPSCEEDLVIHQPDEGSPEQLLGICEECGAWFLIDEAEGFLLRLPVTDLLRDASAYRRGDIA
jgi:uncharacterized protein YbaR (Trm112 family)